MSAADALRHIGPVRGPILWQPPPEPITWTLPKPTVHAGMRYDSVKLGAPTTEDVLKATAVRGAAPLEVTLRIIESASAVPYDVLKQQPHWFNQQIADYLEEFVGAPAPDPLETWRAARRAAEKAAAEQEAAEAEAASKAAAALVAAAAPPP